MGTPIKKSKKECEFESYPVREENIDQYTCVFKQSYERTGFLNSNISGENRPEHWSVDNIAKLECSSHEVKYDDYNVPGINPMVKVQDSCIGHKLKTGDLRNQTFQNVKTKKIIRLDEIQTIVNILSYQIAERAKSAKYSNNKDFIGYNKANPLSAFSNNTDADDDNVSSEKISYKKCIYAILSCISKLQPLGTKNMVNTYDSYPKQIPNLDGGITKNNIGIATGIKPANDVVNTMAPYKQVNNKITRITETPTLSKANIDAVIQTIKNDLNDCICYGDCNGYSVCFCYGNCNHY